MDTATSILSMLWAGGLAATPIALIVGAVCHWTRPRPATRHALWLAVLASFVTPAVGRLLWSPGWMRSERLVAAADAVLTKIEAGERTAGTDRVPEPPVRERSTSMPTEPLRPWPAPPPPPVRVVAVPRVPRAERTPAEIFERAPVAPASVTFEPRTSGGPAHGDPVVACDEAAVDASSEAALDEVATEPATELRSAGPADVPSECAGVSDEAGDAGGEPVIAALAPRASTIDELQGSAAPALSREASAPDRAGHEVRAWVAGLVTLRDSIAELPPVPGVVWLVGAGAIIATHGVRTVRALRVIRRAKPAGGATRALVRAVAADLGMRREPEVVVVESAVSPMIWCGLRPRLVLPLNLWRTLDAESRRAVIVHELAHLKRRDHVLCWAEALIGAAYWWHPVAWWARRKLRDEAEACCDAWVTSLLPRSRKAYATALVATKSFVSEKGQGPSGAGPWLGVMSGSAQKLARRITMVMTQRTAPRVSWMGACVAVLVVAAGTFVTPSIACPPEEGQKSASAPKAVIVRRGDKPKAMTPAPDAPSVQFFGEAPALDAMRGTPAPMVVTIPRTPEPPKAARAPRGPKAARTPQAEMAPQPSVNAFVVPGQPSAPVDIESLKVGRTARVYHLSDGKRDAFWQLMSRADVPVLVEMRGDGVAVYATDEQHPVIESFVRMIDPDAKPNKNAKRRAVGLAVPAEKMRELELEAARAGQAGAYKDAIRAYAESREKMQADVARARENSEQARHESERLVESLAKLQAAGTLHGVGPLKARTQELAALSQALGGQAGALGAQGRTLSEILARLEERTAELSRRVSELEGDEDSDFDDDEEIEVDDVDVEEFDPEAFEQNIEGFEAFGAPSAFAFPTSANPFAQDGDCEPAGCDEACDGAPAAQAGSTF